MKGEKAYLKWTAIVLNSFILCIVAVATVAAVIEHLSKVDDGFEDKISDKRFLEFTMAASIMLAAILGCIGAYLDKKLLLINYLKLLFIPLICQVLFAFNYNCEEQLHATEKFVIRLWEVRDKRPGPMDHLQQKYWCCGINGTSEYTIKKIKVPQSCLYPSTKSLRVMQPFDEGCIRSVQRAHLNICKFIYWIHTITAGLEIVGGVLAIVVYIRIKNRRENNKNVDLEKVHFDLVSVYAVKKNLIDEKDNISARI